MSDFTTHFEHAKQHLRKADPIMGRLIDEIGAVNFSPGGDLFEALVQSVISQVISTAAADTVRRRMDAHTGGIISPEVMAQIDQETYRSFGIGAQKYGYISSIARSFLERPRDFDGIEALGDDEVLRRLVALRGIGKWSAQMVLMFNLGRLDVFAPDDLGLRNAMIRHYALDDDVSIKGLQEVAQRWAPYRTVACVYLWNSIKKW